MKETTYRKIIYTERIYNSKYLDYASFKKYGREIVDLVTFYEKYNYIKDVSIEYLEDLRDCAEEIKYWNLYDDVNGIIKLYDDEMPDKEKNKFIQESLNKLDYENKGIDEIIEMLEDAKIIHFIDLVYLYPIKRVYGKTECWTSGKTECWTSGKTECWTSGKTECWTSGKTECWTSGKIEYKLYLRQYMVKENEGLNNIVHSKYFPNSIVTKKCKICISVELQDKYNMFSNKVEKSKNIIDFLMNCEKYITEYSKIFDKINTNEITKKSLNGIARILKNNNVHYNYIHVLSIGKSDKYKLMKEIDFYNFVKTIKSKNVPYRVITEEELNCDGYVFTLKNITYKE